MTNSPPSSSEASAFPLLDPRIQRWIWAQGWRSLRAIQQLAAAPLLAGEKDVILAAATSAGKTEAAFFPLLTRLLQQESGFLLSVSPLKALINDQTQRLGALCETLDLPVLGWHGDVTASKKLRFLKQMQGVLIITPESLEALFVNKGTTIPALAGATQAVVIDELHSFIGTERGKQVQSLLNRLDLAAGRKIVRVGLSATLGDKALAAEFLRPDKSREVVTIDTGSEGFELKLTVRGYIDEWKRGSAKVVVQPQADEARALPAVSGGSLALAGEPEDDGVGSARYAIGDYLYKELRGSNNLVFPNSRGKVEDYTDLLRRRCEREGVPNEFWAHHGSLSREYREEAEAALKAGVTAATAVCTTTLELGIDIGNIRSVVQIGAAPSVASLRQRMGRSGRRAGEPAILRCLCIENKLTPDSPFSDRIREGLVQNIAMIRLLAQRWVEPPRKDALHASTLVQQILSVIAERGGATAAELWNTLVRSGTFSEITKADFAELLRALGTKEILQQESSGALLPGTLGEKLVNSFEFYSAFTSGEEFRLLADGRTLGSLPIERPLTPGQRIIFAGRRWRVEKIDTAERVILVLSDPGGAPPAFDGTGGKVHDRVREEMKRVLSESAPIPFLDKTAAAMLEEAREWFRFAELGTKRILADGSGVHIVTWRGDWLNDALALLLTAKGCEATNEGVGVRASTTSVERMTKMLAEIAEKAPPSAADLRLDPKDLPKEKWDWVLPADLLLRSFVSSELDMQSIRPLALELLAT